MLIEKENEISVAEKEPIDPKEIWGGNESEWEKWESAKPDERDLNSETYNVEQLKVMKGKETRSAYAKDFVQKYGLMPMPEPSENDLINFFISNGGTIWFKRRFQWRRNDVDFEKDIEKYYKGKLWEKETKEHA